MKIGLTKTENPEKHQFYIDWLKGKDDITITTIAAGDTFTANEFDAIVLSGGVDIHPDYYHGAKNYSNQPLNGWDNSRDEFEQTIFHSAIENNIPVLGICRGLQLINVALKGDLVQDIGELNNQHKATATKDKDHVIIVEPGTLLSDIIGDNKNITTNSAHHQSINKLGDGLRVNARSAEGVIEGIEWKDQGKPFLLAVQWHPERMFRFNLENSPASKAIRERFISEIKKSMST